MFDKKLITESRLLSAQKKDITPLRIDKESAVAIFAGSGGNLYDTTLDKCSCPDFAINGFSQPCKHMIRLAMEMNEVSQEGMLSDISAARGKYYIGKARQYVKESDYRDFLQFAKAFSELYLFGKAVEDDAFSASLNAASVTDLPWFVFQKNGQVKVDKKWAKELKNLAAAVCERLGDELLHRIGNESVMSAMIESENVGE